VLLWRQRALQFTEKCPCGHASSPLLDLPIRQVMGDAHYLPEPSLPEVPRRGGETMAGSPARRSAAGRLLSPRLHPAPAPIAPIAFQNKTVVYDLLFRAAAETLIAIAANPKHLGARVGFTAVLHTWGSALTHHPHVHMIVPGGGLSSDGSRWIACKPRFFLPVRALSRLFRRLFLEGLAALHQAGRLAFFGDLVPLADRRALTAALAPLRRAEWIVYAKRPFAGPAARLSLSLHPSRRDLKQPSHRL
jgi:hypothetical protein